MASFLCASTFTKAEVPCLIAIVQSAISNNTRSLFLLTGSRGHNALSHGKVQ